MTMSFIGRVKATGNVSELLITGIPNDYDDLVIFYGLRQTFAGVEFAMTRMGFNGGGSGIANSVFGDGGSVYTYGESGDFFQLGHSPANLGSGHSNGCAIIQNANSASAKEICLSNVAMKSDAGRINIGTARQSISVAVNSVSLRATQDNFVLNAGSTVTIYGIKRS